MSTARLDDDFWTDPKIETLSPDEKLLFIWFFTNPYRNYSGIYKLPIPMIKEQTGLSDTSIHRGMDRLIDMNLIQYDRLFKVVFICSMLKRQMSQIEGQEKLSETQIKGIVKHLATLHNCPLIQCFLDKYGYLGIEFSYTPADTPIDTPIYTNPKSQPKSQSQPNKNIALSNNKNGYSEDFERFWNVIIHRPLDRKKDAWKHWQKLAKEKKLLAIDEMLLAANIYNEDNANKEPQFLTATYKYLENELFLSSLDSPSKKTYAPDPGCPKCHGQGFHQKKINDGTDRTAYGPCECVNEQIKRDSSQRAIPERSHLQC